MTNKTNFIDFLNKEFSNETIKPKLPKAIKTKTLTKKVSTAKKITAKKISLNTPSTKNRLANASKLIKTMEVFLDNEEMVVDDKVVKEWANVYDNMKINIMKDVEDLIRARKKETKKNDFFMILERKIEYAPQGNILHYSLAIVSLIIISFFTATTFPSFTNKSINTMDSVFGKPINKIIQARALPINKTDEIKKDIPTITKEQLAEYIKNNSTKIINNTNIQIEDIIGKVAGVEE